VYSAQDEFSWLTLTKVVFRYQTVKNQSILVHSRATSTEGAVLHTKMFTSEENIEWNFYMGKFFNCIKRQLIQSEQSKVGCCFWWTYRHLTQKWEIPFLIRGTSISGSPDCIQNMCLTLYVQNWILLLLSTSHVARLWAKGSEVQILVRAIHSIQTNSWAHPASHSVGSKGSFMGRGEGTVGA